MILLGFRGGTAGTHSAIVSAIARNRIGGVWLVDNDSPMGETRGNITSPEQVRRLTADLQSAAHIPLFITIDAEGGEVIRLKEKYGFPKTLSAEQLGLRNDLPFTRRQARTIASTLRSLGINVNLAPVVDLNRNPGNRALGGKGRCFSADPDVTASHAIAVVQEHHAEGILCVAKHFPGHGSALADSHEGLTDISATWEEEELVPYRRLIDAGLPDGIMAGHLLLRRFDDHNPATLSRALVTDLLRTQLMYQGLIISDDLNMGAVTKHYSFESAVRDSINAGVDLILNGNIIHYDEHMDDRMFHAIRSQVESGAIARSRIEESFERIMAVKSRMGVI